MVILLENAMRFMKRLLLFLSVGTVSVVLAGCYGAPAEQQCGVFQPQPHPGTSQPLPDLETAPALPPD